MRIFVVTVASVIAGALLMLAAYSLPTERIFNNVSDSRHMFGGNILYNWAEWGGTDEPGLGWLDVYTDSLMLNTAVFRPYGSVLENALKNPHLEIEDIYMPDNLLKVLAGDNYLPESIYNYSRYWHGYLVFLLPGLEILGYGQLKILLFTMEMLLFAAVILELSRYARSLSFAFVLSALIMSPVSMGLSFNLAPVYVVTLVNMLIILRHYHTMTASRRYVLWALNGIAVAYFDLYTYPVVALSFPLIAMCIVLEWPSLRLRLVHMAECIFSWLFGYVGMWAGKWIICELLTDDNTIQDGISRVLYRAGTQTDFGEVGDTSFGAVLKVVFDIACDRSMLIAILLMLCVMTAGIIRLYRKRANQTIMIASGDVSVSTSGDTSGDASVSASGHISDGASGAAPVDASGPADGWKVFFSTIKSNLRPNSIYLLIAAMPFIYYLLVRNHTAVHPPMEYREIAITFFALSVWLVKITGYNSADRQD